MLGFNSNYPHIEGVFLFNFIWLVVWYNLVNACLLKEGLASDGSHHQKELMYGHRGSTTEIGSFGL